jgi:hypothetical protein
MTIDEDKLSSIYQQGKEQGVSAHLDKTIVAAAHEAVAQDARPDTSDNAASIKKHATAKSPFSGGWPALTSIAAVLLITVILVPLVKQEAPRVATDMVDDENVLLPYTDDFDRSEEAAVTKKKQGSLLKAQKDRQQMQRLDQYLSTPDEQSYSGSMAVEDAVTPVRSVPVAPASRKLEPASSATSSTLREHELKVDNRVQQIGVPLQPDEAVASDALEAVPSADEWQEKIQRLLSDNDYKSAQIELEAFKKYYPDEEIDPSILKQINEGSAE